MTKTPNVYDETVKHHNSLKQQNQNRAFNFGRSDHYIMMLLTFFPELKREADVAAKASKASSKNADKTSQAAMGKKEGGIMGSKRTILLLPI
jgi:hypothetical protein